MGQDPDYECGASGSEVGRQPVVCLQHSTVTVYTHENHVTMVEHMCLMK